MFSKSCHCDHSRFLCVVSGRPGIRGTQLACQLAARLKSDIERQQNVPLQSLKLRRMSFVMHRKKEKCLCEVVGTSTKKHKPLLERNTVCCLYMEGYASSGCSPVSVVLNSCE